MSLNISLATRDTKSSKPREYSERKPPPRVDKARTQLRAGAELLREGRRSVRPGDPGASRGTPVKRERVGTEHTDTPLRLYL